MDAASSLASTMATAATSTMASATSSASHRATSTAHSTQTSTGGDTGGGGRPLLFFVALGFGVVFTNLWIIVGVKYCFRYNQRARHGQIDAETGEPIDLGAVPRPRRKREKKLMTMDEVNERFPLTKYKLWRATREHEGLPAAGGVTAPPSRAASIKETMLERTSTEGETHKFAEDHNAGVEQPRQSTDVTDIQDFAGNTVSSDAEKRPASSRTPETTTTTNTNIPQITTTDTNHHDPEEDEDPITSALPGSTANDLMQTPGDACAICIDTLEDEDEVRGLTCGHAFHAGCLDPWLTSRRACCPLCKADYYVPKPRADATGTPAGEGEGAETGEAGAAGAGRGPRPPSPTWLGRPAGFPMRGHHRVIFGGGRYHVNEHSLRGMPMLPRASRRQQRAAAATQEQEQGPEGEEMTNDTGTADVVAGDVVEQQDSRWMAFSRRFRRSRTTTATTSTQDEEQATPGQLEAGTAVGAAARV